MKINLEENALMITFSISVYKGKTQSWLEKYIQLWRDRVFERSREAWIYKKQIRWLG